MNVVALSGISRLAGGIYYAVSSLCKAMDNAGVSMSAYGRDDAFVQEDQGAWGSVSIKAYRAYGPLGASFQLRRMLADNCPDMLHQHGIWMDDQWAALQWQRKTNLPTIISPHGMLDPWAVRNSAWKKKLAGVLFANESLRRASCIHALCRSEAKSIRAYGLNTPVAVIPNGVDLPVLGAMRQGNTEKELLFLGRIHPKKGLEELIRGWASAKPAGWRLLIAGWDDGGHEQGLKQLVDDAGIDESVRFIGPQYGEEKEALLRSADAFILPSFSEGLPMSVLEAWSYGLPVMMTDFCNIPDGFETDAAVRIKPDAKSIAAGLSQLASVSDAELMQMGANGRKLVEQSYTWDRIATDMKAVYEWCLGGDKPTCILDA